MTIYKKIDGYPDYEVSSCGLVYSHKSKKHLKQTPNNGGYLGVRLYSDNGNEVFFVHRLVATAFVENPEGHNVVNHINGKRDDNRAENLEWCTQSHNKVDGFKKRAGGHAGEHYKATLTREQVLEMRWLYEAGVKVTELADAFDTPVKTVQGIVYGTRWKHVV